MIGYLLSVVMCHVYRNGHLDVWWTGDVQRFHSVVAKNSSVLGCHTVLIAKKWRMFQGH